MYYINLIYDFHIFYLIFDFLLFYRFTVNFCKSIKFIIKNEINDIIRN